jgi:peptide/nickel transport system substrate-binding protein
MERNPCWKGKKPAVETIEIHLYQNMDMLSLALEKGRVDAFYQYADSYPYANIPRLRSAGNFEFLKNSAVTVVFLGFNLGKEPLSDIAFRSAIVHALDYDELVRLEGQGYGEIPDAGFVTPDMIYYRETGKLKQDIVRVKELLRSAGYKDNDGDAAIENSRGEDSELLLLSTPPYLRLCELVREYIRRLGIAVAVKIVDEASWIEMKDRGHYDMVISNTSPWGMRTYAGWAAAYFDARRTGEGVLHNVADPYFLKLCDALSNSREPAKLKELAYAVQDYYAREFPAVALVWKTAIIPCNKKFSGWYVEPIYGIFNVHNFLNLERINGLH